jgi:hypothetical protein
MYILYTYILVMPFLGKVSTVVSMSQALTIPLAPILTFASATTSSITFSFPQQNASVTYSAAVNTDDASNTSITTFNTSGSPSSYTVGNLPKGNQGYKIVITATNRIGSTSSSPLRSVTVPYPTNFTSFTVPSATDGTHPGNNWMQINYTDPTTNGGSITQYKITTVNTTASPNVTTNPVVTGSPFYVGSLTSNAQYTFTIVTTYSFTNASGTVTSQTATAGTYYKWTLPDAPSVTGTANSGPTSMLVYFNTVSGPASSTNYVGCYSGIQSSIKRAVSPVDVYGLGGGGTYSFTVVAVNSSGYSAQSNSTNATTNGSYTNGFNQLMYYFNFEQSTTDITANNNSNTVTNNTGWTPNGSISFPSNNNCTVGTSGGVRGNYVSFANGPSFTIAFSGVLSMSEGFTICFWFNIPSCPYRQPVLFEVYNGSGDGLTYVSNLSRGDWYSFPNIFRNPAGTVDLQFNYNQWYHVAFVFDQKANTMNSYLDGTYATTYGGGSWLPGINQYPQNSLTLSLGGALPGDYSSFPGNFQESASFDEIQGYRVPLNQSQISAIRNNSGFWVGY